MVRCRSFEDGSVGAQVHDDDSQSATRTKRTEIRNWSTGDVVRAEVGKEAQLMCACVGAKHLDASLLRNGGSKRRSDSDNWKMIGT